MDDQELEGRRISLLKELTTIRSVDGDLDNGINEKDEIRLKRYYNEIIDQQIARQRGLLPDPLDVLPSELWIEIFQYYVCSTASLKPMHSIFILTLVSLKWQNAVIKTPELWSKITVGKGPEETEFLTKMHTCLHLSGNSPLTLFIEDRTPNWDAILSLFLPHVDRIRSLVIQKRSTESKYEEEGMKYFTSPEIVLSFGRLPALRSLDVRQGHSLGKEKTKIFPENTPSLIFSRGTYLPVSTLRHRNLSGLCVFACESPLDVVIPFIIHLPSLRSLSLGSRRKSKYAEQVPPIHISPADWPTFPLIKFTYEQPSQENSALFICRLLDLVSLKVTPSWERLGGILSVLPLVPKLEELTIRVTDASRGPISLFTPEDTQRPFFVKGLEISFKNFPTQDLQELRLDNCRRLFSVLQGCATSVQRLSINDWTQVDVAVDYIRSLPLLEQLRLHPTYPREDISIPPLRLDLLQLLQLNLSPTTTSQILSTLRASDLNKLNLDGEEIQPIFEVATLELEDWRYPKLNSLKWPTDSLVWKFTSLNSLVWLNFKHTSPVTASDFCIYLTYRPHDFPALQSITFGSQPEWDCVMMMLERRNFLYDKTVSLINTLLFPSRVPLYLRRPISDLLRGCFTQRPSNYELSISGIGETYFDNTISGCHLCHTSFQICQARLVYLGQTSLWFRRNCSEYLQEVIPDPPLSNEITSWINGRQGRYDAWSSLQNDWMQRSRPISCDPLHQSYTYLVTALCMADLNVDSVVAQE